MTSDEHEHWIALRPPFDPDGGGGRLFIDHVHQLIDLELGRPNPNALQRALLDSLAHAEDSLESERPLVVAAIRVVSDLASQGWRLRVHDSGVEVAQPVELAGDRRGEKERIRRQELLRRNEQLAQPATRRFVQGMERKRVHNGRFTSIFSLMRDGRELASRLRDIRTAPPEERESRLASAIDPYLEFVSDGATCGTTGLSLQDIWRYFRHTWTNQYASTPGRSMMMLVRDRAAENHPVIGIASLGSPIAQIRERDTWLGWHPSTFLAAAAEENPKTLTMWMERIIASGIADLYLDDLHRDGVVAPAELKKPSAEAIARLEVFSQEQRRYHNRFEGYDEHKRKPDRNRFETQIAYWTARAETHLFRSKRALQLAELLQARLQLQSFIGKAPSRHQIAELLSTKEGRKAVSRVLRKAKADRMGIAIADTTVCGAIPPYTHLLGGKLVAMLASSPEVVEAYRSRYGAARSEIASAMAGRPVTRPAHLVYLGTTSLYGVGSSQYNRIRIPAERLGGEPGEELRYLELGKSEAFGTSQYGADTVECLVTLVQQTNGSSRVNSIFGEGVSPRLRKVRGGLDALRFPADSLLRHGRRRIVYGVSLVRNLRAYLLGMDEQPDYICNIPGQVGTGAIAEWWRERWLTHRIESDDILAQVESHTLVRPITHGAVVPVPDDESDQLGLFDDLRQ